MTNTTDAPAEFYFAHYNLGEQVNTKTHVGIAAVIHPLYLNINKGRIEPNEEIHVERSQQYLLKNPIYSEIRYTFIKQLDVTLVEGVPDLIPFIRHNNRMESEDDYFFMVPLANVMIHDNKLYIGFIVSNVYADPSHIR